MAEAFDLVILGGGCAGLSLAMALATQGARCPKTLVIESRSGYTNDRTWCFWNDPSVPGPFPVQHRWQTMRVAHAGQSVSLDCGSQPYQMLAAQDFYAAALATVDRQPNIALRLGATVVGEPHRSGSGSGSGIGRGRGRGRGNGGSNLWHIRTSAGDVSAPWVVDTRPSVSPRLGGAVLWQSFYGQEIECSAPVFDPAAIDLMNFLAPDPSHIAFVYVLPVTSTRALVEVTVFGEAPLTPQDLRLQLDAVVAQRVGGARFTSLRHEHGILPMGLNPVRQTVDPGHVRVGLMAGGARPSTGYAFLRIQRWAAECALSLLGGGGPTGHRPDPLLLRTMDRIFLDVLRANPAGGGALFFSLFSRVDPARVIRFLSGQGSALDGFAVVAAMPVQPFLRAALGLARRGGRVGSVEGLA